jgi:hypothetical protein
LPIIEQQIQKAGVRMAALFNSIFGSEEVTPNLVEVMRKLANLKL